MANPQNIIASIFQQQGIPAWIGLSIAKTESSFNPNAVGDNGTSYGLFQLHYGGQANGYTPTQLKNPVINTEVAAPPIKRAFDKSVQMGLSGTRQLDYVANHSGHPDSLGVNWTQANTNYDTGLNQAYAALGGSGMYGAGLSSPLQNLSNNSGYGSNPFTSPLQQDAQGTTNMQLNSSAIGFFERISEIEHKGLNPLHPGEGLFFRGGEFLFGLILLAIGVASLAYKVRGGK